MPNIDEHTMDDYLNRVKQQAEEDCRRREKEAAELSERFREEDREREEYRAANKHMCEILRAALDNTGIPARLKEVAGVLNSAGSGRKYYGGRLSQFVPDGHVPVDSREDRRRQPIRALVSTGIGFDSYYHPATEYVGSGHSEFGQEMTTAWQPPAEDRGGRLTVAIYWLSETANEGRTSTIYKLS